MSVNTDDIIAEAANNQSDLDGRFLTFFTDGQLFGVPIAGVVQIVGMQEIVKVPGYPDYAKGIINLRGAIIPIIDMRLRLNKSPAEYDERTCTIVTSIHQLQVGFIVDSVDEVTDVDDEHISAPPRISGDYAASYVTGIASLPNKIILLLDTDRLLGAEELQYLVATTSEEA